MDEKPQQPLQIPFRFSFLEKLFHSPVVETELLGWLRSPVVPFDTQYVSSLFSYALYVYCFKIGHLTRKLATRHQGTIYRCLRDVSTIVSTDLRRNGAVHI